jgi:hypothetical protein
MLDLWQGIIQSVREPKRPLDWIAFLLPCLPLITVVLLMLKYVYPVLLSIFGQDTLAKLVLFTVGMPVVWLSYAIPNVLLFRAVDHIYGTSR